jgi:hypothetical protein
MIDLENIEFIDEGTWALSKSFEKRRKEGAIWIQKIKDFKEEIYNIFGDDTLFDRFDAAIRRIKELVTIPEDEISEGLNEDVVIPASLSQQYLVVKKQMADKQSQKDILQRQINQKETEINILMKNLIAIEQKAAQLQGQEATVKTAQTTTAETQGTEATKKAAATPTTNESKISDLFAELNEMDQDWLLEWGAEEFEEEGEGETGEVADVLDYEDIEDEQKATDEDLNSDYVFAIRINDPNEDEEIIAKIYRNEDDAFWKIRVVQGSEEPLEAMQFDPDMEFLDIIEKIGEIYDEVEEISMEEYKGLLDDKQEKDAEFYPKEEMKENLNEGRIKIPDDFKEYKGDWDDSKPGNYIITFDAGPKRKFNINAKNINDAMDKIYAESYWSEGSINMMLDHVKEVYFREKKRSLTNAEYEKSKFNRAIAFRRAGIY